mgnify:CR=1 FL=1
MSRGTTPLSRGTTPLSGTRTARVASAKLPWDSRRRSLASAGAVPGTPVTEPAPSSPAPSSPASAARTTGSYAERYRAQKELGQAAGTPSRSVVAKSAGPTVRPAEETADLSLSWPAFQVPTTPSKGTKSSDMSTAAARASREKSFFGTEPAAEPRRSPAPSSATAAPSTPAASSELPWTRLARPGSRRSGKAGLERTLTLPSTPPSLRKTPPAEKKAEPRARSPLPSPPPLQARRSVEPPVQQPVQQPPAEAPTRASVARSPVARSPVARSPRPPPEPAATHQTGSVARSPRPPPSPAPAPAESPTRAARPAAEPAESPTRAARPAAEPAESPFASRGGLRHSPPGSAQRARPTPTPDSDEPSPALDRTSSPPLPAAAGATLSAKKNRVLDKTNRRHSTTPDSMGGFGNGELTEDEKAFIAQAKARRVSGSTFVSTHEEPSPGPSASPPSRTPSPTNSAEEHTDVFSSPSPAPTTPAAATRRPTLSSATRKRLQQRRASLQASPVSTTGSAGSRRTSSVTESDAEDDPEEEHAPAATNGHGPEHSNGHGRAGSAGRVGSAGRIGSASGTSPAPSSASSSKAGSGRPPRPPASGSSSGTVRRAAGGTLRRAASVSKRSATGGEQYLVPLAELAPHPAPDTALRDAQAALKRGDVQETWMDKCEGLHILRQLVRHHPDVVRDNLHAINLLVINEVQNLRSSVARLAICALSDMYQQLGRVMDQDLDQTVTALLAKLAAESGSVFICEDTDKALEHMIGCVTPRAAINALLLSLSHKSKLVRRAVAKHLSDLVGATGPRVFALRECDRLFKGLTTLTQDQSPQTRYLGRKAFYIMSSFDNFDSTLSRMLSGATLKSVQDLVASLRTKGLGDMPADAQLSRHGSTSASDGSPMRRGTKRGTLRSTGASPTRTGSSGSSPVRLAPGQREGAQQAMEDIIKELIESDWKQRDSGVSNLEEFVEEHTDFAIAHLQRLFDAFVPRLTDMNSKVNNHALAAMRQFIPILGPGLEPLATQLVPVLAQNLASKTPAIRTTATESLDLMIEHLDPAVLVQPYCAAAEFGNSKVMTAMVPIVCALVPRLHPQHTKLLQKHAIALQVKLLGEAKGGLKAACHALCVTLHETLGPELLDLVPAAHRTAVQNLLANG